MGCEIIEDSRQQLNKHEIKHEWWRAHSVAFSERDRALPFGDYVRDGSNISIDTKKDLTELSTDVGRDHRRFRNECDRAAESGWRLVVLVETDEAETADDLEQWVHPTCRRCDFAICGHCDPLHGGICDMWGKKQRPVQGHRFVAILRSLERRHGVRFEFCKPQDSARRICELLGVGWSE